MQRLVGASLAGTILLLAAMVSPVAADNLGGVFNECAEVVEYVPPSADGNGYLKVRGIGPGLFNPIDDTVHHSFPFAAGLSLDATLSTRLAALAASDGFTCLRMSTQPNEDQHEVVVALLLLSTERICGDITRDRAGVYAITDTGALRKNELIGTAQDLVAADRYLEGRLDALRNGGARSSCLNFGMDTSGNLVSLTIDLDAAPCGRVDSRGGNLVVAGHLVADANSTTAQLLPPQALAAISMLLDTEREACVHLQILDSQIQSVVASLVINETICGAVSQAASGDFQLGDRTIPSVLLSTTQRSQLTNVLGGMACFEPTLQENRYHGEILNLAPGSNPQTPVPTARTTPPPLPSPSAVATASPGTPTASPSLAASQTAGVSPSPSNLAAGPIQPSDGDPTAADGSPVIPVALATLILLALASGAYFVLGVRRRTPATAAPATVADPGSMDMAVASGGARAFAGPAVATEPADVGAAELAGLVGAVVPRESGPSSQHSTPDIALTPREQEVLGMLFDGLSNKEIANRLFISESTAGVHVSNLMAKLGARSRAEAATLAVRMGIARYDEYRH